MFRFVYKDEKRDFVKVIARYLVTTPVILFSLLTVFLTGFLILELQVL